MFLLENRSEVGREQKRVYSGYPVRQSEQDGPKGIRHPVRYGDFWTPRLGHTTIGASLQEWREAHRSCRVVQIERIWSAPRGCGRPEDSGAALWEARPSSSSTRHQARERDRAGPHGGARGWVESAEGTLLGRSGVRDSLRVGRSTASILTVILMWCCYVLRHIAKEPQLR